MNTEKAIKEINRRIELANRHCLNLSKEYIQAIKLAMEALRKQEPMKQKLTTDAIEYLNNKMKQPFGEKDGERNDI